MGSTSKALVSCINNTWSLSLAGLDIQKHLEDKQHENQHAVAFPKAYYIHSFPVILCRASIHPNTCQNLKPFYGLFAIHRKQSIKSSPDMESNPSTESKKITLLAAWLDRIYLSSMSLHLFLHQIQDFYQHCIKSSSQLCTLLSSSF